MQAICLAANNDSADAVRDLWKTVGRWEASPSMAAMKYPPHITLAIYDDVRTQLLYDAAFAVFAGKAALRVRFEAVRSFPSSPLVLWAEPADARDLKSLHRSIHDRVDPELCHELYRPATWIPHCTLGTAVAAAHRNAALALVEQPLEPFEVLFDTADCVTYPPVQLRERVELG